MHLAQPLPCCLALPAHPQPATMLCLLDVARGLEFLHSCNIVHGGARCGIGEAFMPDRVAGAAVCGRMRQGAVRCLRATSTMHPTEPLACVPITDIKPQNVLIKTENRDRRGYVCKVG